MANTYLFRGDAVVVAQIDLITVAGTWAADDTATLTINGKDIVITIGATATTDAVATAIKEAWNGDTITGDATRSTTGNLITEFAEVVATVASSVVTLTAGTAGKPFTLTVTEVTAGTGTATESSSVVSNGPNHWTKENFFKDGAPSDNVPGAAAAATVFIEDSSVDILYDLDQSAQANFLTALNISSGYSGSLGLPQTNASGYAEYRDRYLQLPDQVGNTAVKIGEGDGSGSSRILLDFGASQTTLSIFGSGSGPLEDRKAIVVKGSSTSNTLEISGGELDIAPDQDDTAAFATVKAFLDADLRASAGTTIEAAGGLTVEDSASVEVMSDTGGTIILLTATGSPLITISGDSLITTLNLLGGSLDYQSSGTITTLNGGPDASITFEGNPNAVTLTNVNVEARFTLNDPDSKVTFTNPINQGNIDENDWTHNFGKGRTLHPLG